MRLPCFVGSVCSQRSPPGGPAGHGQGSPTSLSMAAFPELPLFPPSSTYKSVGCPAALVGGEWAGRRGHMVEEGRSDPCPGQQHRSQCRLGLCPLPLLGRGPCLSAPNPFLHPENPFITDTIPDPEDPAEGWLSPTTQTAGVLCLPASSRIL